MTTDPLELLEIIERAFRSDDRVLLDEALEVGRALRQGYRDHGTYCEIPLTQGFWAKIDHADLERVLNYKWFKVGGEIGDRGEPPHPRAKISGRVTPLGRFILGLPVGDPRRADHINYDNLDNRRLNLRIASKEESATHRRGWHRRTGGTRSKFKGVYLGRSLEHPAPWRASIKVGGRPHHLGYFQTEEEAARAYDRAALDHHGEFCETNFG